MLDKQILTFNESIEGLRDFVNAIEPFLLDKHKEVQEEHEKHISPLIISGMINTILEKQREKEVADNDKEKFLQLIETKSELDEEINKIYQGAKIEVSFEEIEKLDDDSQGIALKGLKIKSSKPIQIDELMTKYKKSKNFIELLYINSFISLINSSEWFFSQILHFYYNQFPQSAGIDKMQLSLENLKSFQTIKDAENFLIENKVEDILRGSFDKWIKVLKEELKLGLGYLDEIEQEIIEIYQRRNIIVHNGGVINNIYLSKVSKEYRNNIKIGDKLEISKDYLDNAICRLQLLYLLIASELWKKLEAGNVKRADILTEIVYDNLVSARWDISEGLSFFIKNDAQMEPIDKTIAHLNYWLCKKRKGQYDKIKKEVDSANFSDKKEILQLGLAGLKEDKTEFFKILPLALKGENLDIKKLGEFPIFEEIRQLEEYKEFVSKYNDHNENPTANNGLLPMPPNSQPTNPTHGGTVAS